ncbi:hypothetical protein [Actinoplanes derwentensis]|uniref:HEXXH motif-containing protein n=1 Tax=Actinoplanes derwentensis TaxID=113562 RepID=A0A1H1RYQ0_9ACTN|nr:hypothetical protein [Actinoplanes derwentensis]GID84557.1 hypothetical protein Ade03nite_34810 [Actinoplanes derwentensis]SDS40872.1 hypothetical protein SAMN04489716_0720 [Actinoplanes derwentensis]
MPNEPAADGVIAALPDILAFVPGPGLMEIRRRFTSLAADALGRRVAAVIGRDSARGASLRVRLAALPSDGLLRLITVPETIHRVLWPELYDADELARFLRLAVEAEHARDGREHELTRPTWTARGDVMVGGANDAATLALNDFPPIVLGDPQRRRPTAVLAGDDDSLVPADALRHVAGQLLEVRRRMRDCGDEIWAFTREFTSTLVLRAGGGMGGSFGSSSPERYVGRSILWNPHDPEVTVEDLAEAVVHEAIHTVMDSADVLLTRATPAGVRWIVEPRLYDGVSRAASAWTGRELDVPTYVHACLVWYGLLCFWTRAMVSGAFDATTARRRIIRAGGPFMRRSALEPLRPFMSAVRPDVAALLEAIQERVAEEFAGLSAAAAAR